MLGATHDYELLIQEQHLDTFGHVNNAAYLQILEQARWDLVTRNGYGLDEVHRRQVGPVVLEIRLRFRRELRNRQRVTIRSWVESLAGKTGKFEQQILEQARWDLVTRNGYGLDEVHERKIGPVILEIRMRFRRELRNRQHVTIRSWVESYAGKTGKLEQHILDDAGNLCCEAAFTVGLFDLATRKLIEPTPEWLAALELRPEDLAAASR